MNTYMCKFICVSVKPLPNDKLGPTLRDPIKMHGWYVICTVKVVLTSNHKKCWYGLDL